MVGGSKGVAEVLALAPRLAAGNKLVIVSDGAVANVEGEISRACD